MGRSSNGMAYRRGGNGPTVVLLHGIPGQGQLWERVQAGLDGAFTAAAANASLHVFHGAGHFLPHERPAEVAREIAAFATAASR